MFDTDPNSADNALRRFLPRAGRRYAARRNHDEGPGPRDNVSMLSPWIRLRILPEWTVCKAVLNQHSHHEAAKFIDEVCWRTYWKGWLEGRPTVWRDYLRALELDRSAYAQDSDYCAAIRGKTGIDCMDAWARELRATGYLHNHARMWFASIWVHTLRLPWTLGAAFFLEHLLDGDAASNTLGWRWVAGLQTRGKAYLATRDNIRKFTSERFRVNADLATEPIDLADSPERPPYQSPEPLPQRPQTGRIGCLLHDDDARAADWLRPSVSPDCVAACLPEATYAEHRIAKPVTHFRRECLRNALGTAGPYCSSETAVLDWARAEKLQQVVMAKPFVGLWDAVTPRLSRILGEHGIQLTLARHWWDEVCFPHATAGFFRFKKAIPAALEQFENREHAS